MKKYLKKITNALFMMLMILCQANMFQAAQPAATEGHSPLKAADSSVIKQVNEVLKVFPLAGLEVQVVDTPYRDPKSNYTYPQGIVVSGDLSFNKPPLSVLKKMLPGLDNIMVHGLVTKPISNMELEASISKSAIKMGAARLTDLSIHLMPSTGSFGLGCTMLIPTPKGATMKAKAGEQSVANFLAFKGAIDLKGTDLVFQGSLDGDLDVKGFILEKVGLEAQLDITTLGFPTGVGIRATMDIGKKQIKFAAKAAAGATTTSMLFIGSLECAQGATKDCGIYYSDIVNIATKMMKIKLPDALTKKVPKIGIDTFYMQIVPIPTTIAGESYSEGTSIDMTMKLFGATATAKARMNISGMEGEGSISKISIPNRKPIIIIADKKDGHDGPSISMKMNKSDVDFAMSGYAEIVPFQMGAEAHMQLKGDHFIFDITAKLFGALGCKVDGDFSLSHPENDSFSGDLDQDVIEKIANLLLKASQQIEKQAGKDLSGAEHESDAKINKEIANIKDKIKKQDDSLKRDKKKCKKADVGACARVAKEAAKLAGLESDLKIALPTAKGSSHGILEISKAGAHGIGEAGKGIAAASKDIVNNVVNIKHIKFAVSMRDLQAGKSPVFSISGKVFGKNINLNNVSVDFSHPDKLMESIVKEIMKKINK